MNQELGFSLGHRKRLLALLDCLREGREGNEWARSGEGDGGSMATLGWLSTSAVLAYIALVYSCISPHSSSI